MVAKYQRSIGWSGLRLPKLPFLNILILFDNIMDLMHSKEVLCMTLQCVYSSLCLIRADKVVSLLNHCCLVSISTSVHTFLPQDALSSRTSVFLSDVETDSWPPDTVMQLAAQSNRWLVTRGEFGAHEFTAEQVMRLVEPVKVATVPSEILACAMCIVS